MANKERENFYKVSSLIIDITKASFVDLLELHLSFQNISFEDFIDLHQHEIYHLHYNTRKCCQCTPGYILPNNRILNCPQLEVLFDRYARKPVHRLGNLSDFCCAKPRTSITANDLDLTLIRVLLVKFCNDIFWYSCLTLQSLEDFLNQNKHQIYHLLIGNRPCSQCPPNYKYPVRNPVINLQTWNLLFNLRQVPCSLHGNVSCDLVCTDSASPGITVKHLNDNVSTILIEQCCPLFKIIEDLTKLRNTIVGHARAAKIPEADYARYKREIESGIIVIAKVCKNEAAVMQSLSNLNRRTLDETLCIQYQNMLLEWGHREDRIERVLNEVLHLIGNRNGPRESDETNTNSPTPAENTLQINEELRTTVTLIEDLASANESSSKTKKALKTAFEFLSVIKVIDKKLSAVVETAEKIYKMRHDKKLDDILKSIESKIDEELTIKFKVAKTFFVRKISFLSGLSIHKINKNDTVFINQNVEPFKNLEFMTEVLERIEKEKKLGKRRNFSKLMKYIQEYIILSVLRAITFKLYLRILDESPNFNITGGVVAIDNDQTEDDSSLLQFLVQPSQDTLVYNFMYNPTNYKVVDTLIKFYFPDQGKQLNSIEYLCNGKYVIKSVKYNGAFLYMVDIAGTWLRWQKQETDQSTFTFSKTDIDGKTYFKIRSSKWKGYCAIIGGFNIWARGIGSGSDNEGLFEIIKFKENEDSKEDLYSFSPKDSKATFLIANESGRVSGRQCPPCPETFFKIERRNSLTT